MSRGIMNIVIGGFFVVGGASGKLALIGTNSTTALIVLGSLLAGFGVYQAISK